jgi:hypothetical protein
LCLCLAYKYVMLILKLSQRDLRRSLTSDQAPGRPSAGRSPREAVIWITCLFLAAPSDSSILDCLSIRPSIRGWTELINLLHVHPTTFEQTAIARTISDPARSVMLRRPGRGTAHASARGGNWSRRIDFSAQHFGWASETGRSRFKTACEYYLRREEGGAHGCILHDGRSGPVSDFFASRALQHFEERLEE